MVNTNENLQNRSEEVQNIIERMPNKFNTWVIYLIIGLSVILFCFGFIIEYPETLDGEITITAQKAPVKLVANINGKLQLINNDQNTKVNEGCILAYIENTADYKDVIETEKLLRAFSPSNSLINNMNNKFKDNLNLGELDISYYTFLNNVSNVESYKKDNNYVTREQKLVSLLKTLKESLDNTLELKDISSQRLKYTFSSYRKDSIQYYNLKSITEKEFDQTRTNLLNIKQTVITSNNELAELKKEINNANFEITQLLVEKKENEQQLQMNLTSSYNRLLNEIEQWKQKYLFVAPFKGKVEFLGFWRNNDFVSMGQEIFSIVPGENKIVGQVILPAYGAGKVEVGQEVNIKLDVYPFNEYGITKGLIKSISKVSNSMNMKLSPNIMESYLLYVEMPNGLRTNYGVELEFKYGLNGIAEIVVKKRKLIQRLFDNLKYSASGK